MKLLMGRIETFAAPSWSKAPIHPRDAMVRFFMSLPLAFFAKTSRLVKIANVPWFAGFLSTGRGWGSSRGFEPLAPIRAFWGGDGCLTRPVVSTPSKFGDAKKPRISAYKCNDPLG
jgi:hypothetical protein